MKTANIHEFPWAWNRAHPGLNIHRDPLPDNVYDINGHILVRVDYHWYLKGSHECLLSISNLYDKQCSKAHRPWLPAMLN